MIILVIGILSWIVHELGHVGVAYSCGWKPHHIATNKRWLSVGVAYIPRDNADMWKVGLGGPMVSFILALWFLFYWPAMWAVYGVFFNILIAAINLLPFKPADGGYIWGK